MKISSGARPSGGISPEGVFIRSSLSFLVSMSLESAPKGSSTPKAGWCDVICVPLDTTATKLVRASVHPFLLTKPNV